ncbi:amine-terminal domain cyclin (macronuclear) [Tetrahymena thermophila SB210]|uniref:Amine-terminal domain cyclin n=1 Tax=Tetrahymena thermophila (strain SB210) TaxID=312017 RepID=Q24FW6_TETTS|nr:amine-terminal domain cyclin [Tetrahymena thermophila SB210]EAS06644.3 amine-terminal domain cyclin [Tetrahymena thermophila SB210]|eukprot:XP_001026889.3 amine-terminal domain cyclin [Tetrahymena thermophila SB210]
MLHYIFNYFITIQIITTNQYLFNNQLQNQKKQQIIQKNLLLANNLNTIDFVIKQMEDQNNNNNNNNNKNPNKKDIPKIGPKLQNNKQCNKKSQNSALMFLSTSKMEQEEILKEKKLEKAKKNLKIGFTSGQIICESQIDKENFMEDDKQEIAFYEEQQNIMEEDEDDSFDSEEGNQQIGQHFNSDKLRDRQWRYNQLYGDYEDLNLLNQEVDLSNCLKNHKIPSILRSKMVDWMIEVFGNYKQTSSDKTYFRAVGLLDLFFKKQTKKLVESDVHLFGIAAMFLATKQEDISHISLDDIVEKVGHNKFTEKKIREAEYEILRIVDMKIDFPTTHTYLNRYLYKIFSSETNQTILQLTHFSLYILKQCVHDDKLLDYKSHILAFSAIVVSLKVYFSNLKGDSISPYNDLIQQEVQIMEKMFELISQSEHQNAKECIQRVNNFVFSFNQRYPELRNLEKFHY